MSETRAENSSILPSLKTFSTSPGRGGESFWEDTTRQILRNAIPILFAATGTVHIGDVLSFVRSAPRTPDFLVNGSEMLDW